jgi:hypothetical protein
MAITSENPVARQGLMDLNGLAVRGKRCLLIALERALHFCYCVALASELTRSNIGLCQDWDGPVSSRQSGGSVANQRVERQTTVACRCWHKGYPSNSSDKKSGYNSGYQMAC